MDPVDFRGFQELLRFLHIHKTELSCMENPRTFLSQLKDYDLIPDQRYLQVKRRRSKEALKNDVYEILDWLEKERPERIHTFWKCVFKESIMNIYPLLKELRRKLMDASYHFETQLPEKVWRDERRRQERSEEDEGEEQVTQRVCDDEEQQPSTSQISDQSHLSRNASSSKEGDFIILD